jgi:transposase InsO family protein
MHPGMNAFVERLNGSIRREALDYFLLFSEKQICKIIKDYVYYHNHQRPHQGIGGIPDPLHQFGCGKIRKYPILGGLHHSYFRSSA